MPYAPEGATGPKSSEVKSCTLYNMERRKKTGNQQDQMEELHGCPMLQKEPQDLRREESNVGLS
jgi:hypothetical protein